MIEPLNSKKNTSGNLHEDLVQELEERLEMKDCPVDYCSSWHH